MEPAAEQLTPLMRPYGDDDRHFIVQSWMRSYWDGLVEHCSLITPPIYNYGQRRLIEMLLAKPRCTVVIAHHPQEREVILGWLALESQPHLVVHYIYVKSAFRRLGIAKQLLSAVGIKAPDGLIYTHITRKAKAILSRMCGATFSPWSLIECREEFMIESQRRAM